MVWLINVETTYSTKRARTSVSAANRSDRTHNIHTSTTTDNTKTTFIGERPATSSSMMPSIFARSPLAVTPFPREMPPIARKTTVQRNCSKSSCERYGQYLPRDRSSKRARTFVRIPVPKNATIGMTAMMPMSPMYPSIARSKHQRPMVKIHTNAT
jgi:hypothetical protein